MMRTSHLFCFVSIFLFFAIGCGSDLEEKSVIVVDESQLDATVSVYDPMDPMATDIVDATEPAIAAVGETLEPLEDRLAAEEIVIPAIRSDRDLGFEEKVQIALAKAGYYRGTVDGKVGSDTRDAIKEFQEANGLMADGMVGNTTWEKLKDYYYEPE